MTLYFVGDLMGHSPLSMAAKDGQRFNYDGFFKKVASELQAADYTIANLETTISRDKIKGYPRFATPYPYLVAAKKAGINVMMTANNHSLDYRQQGLYATLHYLDSLQILHTGTFRSARDRERKNLLVLSKGHINIGLLNYTFSTNRIRIQNSALVNRMYLGQMYQDIIHAKAKPIDKLVVFLHWGMEGEMQPRVFQRELVQLFRSWGVDVIIGAHPHVIQPFVKTQDDFLVAYSLGNFISNQRQKYHDGGVIFKIRWIKSQGEISLDKIGYDLVWFDKYTAKDKTHFELVHSSDDAYMQSLPLDRQQRMKQFRMKMIAHLDSTSVNIFPWEK